MVKAIVFDFDGMILESVDIKTRAFCTMFEKYPQHLDKIVRLHLDNGSMSRFENFQIIYYDYLGLSIGEDELDRLGKEFSRLVYKHVLECPFVPGAYQFLKARCAEGHRLFIASGTPENELRDIVRGRRLTSFFDGVYGSPRSKSEILRAILAENNLPPNEAVSIGDALGDFQSAFDVSIPFIGRVPSGEPDRFPDHGVIAVVQDLRGLELEWQSVLERTPS